MAIKPRVVAGSLVVVLGIAGAIASTFEGNPKLSYMDRLASRPTPTACHGHTGSDVKVGVHYSEAQCKKWFDEDLAKANAIVRRCTTRLMPAQVEGALTDFTFNEGAGGKDIKDGFCTLKNGKQPQIRALANEGDWAGVCKQFQYWVTSGGVRLAGLVARRLREQKDCEKAL